MRKRQVRRSNKLAGKKLIVKRMKEIWADGYFLGPVGPSASNPKALTMVRAAMLEVVEDQEFWDNLDQMVVLNLQRTELRKKLLK